MGLLRSKLNNYVLDSLLLVASMASSGVQSLEFLGIEMNDQNKYTMDGSALCSVGLLFNLMATKSGDDTFRKEAYNNIRNTCFVVANATGTANIQQVWKQTMFEDMTYDTGVYINPILLPESQGVISSVESLVLEEVENLVFAFNVQQPEQQKVAIPAFLRYSPALGDARTLVRHLLCQDGRDPKNVPGGQTRETYDNQRYQRRVARAIICKFVCTHDVRIGDVAYRTLNKKLVGTLSVQESQQQLAKAQQIMVWTLKQHGRYDTDQLARDSFNTLFVPDTVQTRAIIAPLTADYEEYVPSTMSWTSILSFVPTLPAWMRPMKNALKLNENEHARWRALPQGSKGKETSLEEAYPPGSVLSGTPNEDVADSKSVEVAAPTRDPDPQASPEHEQPQQQQQERQRQSTPRTRGRGRSKPKDLTATRRSVRLAGR